MSNHFHLVAETSRGNLVDGMKWLLGVYANRFNHLIQSLRDWRRIGHHANPTPLRSSLTLPIYGIAE